MLDVEINDILEKLDVYLTSLILKCKFFEKSYEYDSIKKEGKLRILVKEEVNKIERLKEEVNNDEDELLDGETKKFKLLTDLKYEKKKKKKRWIAKYCSIRIKINKINLWNELIELKNSVLSS